MNPKSEFKNFRNGNFHKLLAVPAAAVLLCLVAAHSPAQNFKVLHHFTASDGSTQPYGGLVLSGTILYGTTCGPYPPGPDWGGVFKVNTDGSGFTMLKKFSGTDGSHPWRDLVVSGTTLYGVTREGGTYGHGTVFRINTDGTGFTVLKDFVGYYDGYEPSGRLVLSGPTLYGMTSVGGGYGNVFKINTNGGGFTVLKNFAPNSPDGFNLSGGLTLSGTTLYGTTVQGGITNAFDAYGCGTVFCIDTDGSGFSVLKRFLGGDDGQHPDTALIISGSTLYGTTDWYASTTELNYGTIFSVNVDGSNFKILRRFTNSVSDGKGPVGLALFNGKLYGATRSGGVSGRGLIFRINTDGSDFTVLQDFTGVNGASPNGSLVSDGTTIYGTTGSGGISNMGTIFALGLPPRLTRAPQSQTAETGATIAFSVDATNSLTATYQWFFDETNLVGCSTNDWLELTNCDYSQSGTYTVVVTNVFGSVTSAPVMLNVIPLVERRPVPAINLTGDAESSLNVEFTDAVRPTANWLPLDTVNLTNPSEYWFDLTEPLPPQRFYRVWQTGTPAVVPSLSLPALVPAITLAGNIGDSLRVDYINAVGPTNAWVTLDTVTLTNTPQLYFDTSSIRQPRRLYRILPGP